MKIAVITPYRHEPLEWLRQGHESVLAQGIPCTHIMIADGMPRDEIDSWDVQHIKLPQGHADFGNTPRAIGCISAITQGFEALAYLDGDNWYYPDHITSLVALHHKTGAVLCSSNRMFHRLDGSPMGICPLSDGNQFFDVNCMFWTKEALDLVPEWYTMGHMLAALADRYLAHLAKERKLTRAFSDKTTVAYRTAFTGDYELFGETPPAEGTKAGKKLAEALKWCQTTYGMDLRLKRVRKPLPYSQMV